MEWLHTLSVIVTGIGTAYYFSKDIKEDIKLQTARLDAANARIDQLHVMFYELLKEGRKQ